MEVAVKVIKKAHMDEDELENLQREVEIMSKVDHKNIVKYFETYNDKKCIYLVMELCTGGELFQRVTEHDKPMRENDVAKIMS